ncbi:MAG: tRNA 4-thiouridine(8) synthase ThiI [Candidatus Paceibacterota bacterium]|jgi:tRNA U34 2-thiouridine synthase MnmA/TrmU|nr:tRNA 4-thiouridine(8) synthase ThiI [bacterium]
MKKQVKCLSLLSGGLDSMLAIKILEANGVKVQPISFVSYFFNSKSAQTACDNQGWKLRVEDISEEHLKMVKNPKHGHGSAYNPCIDCHLMMLKEAKKIMEAEGYDFIATGEVVGQRPMSQNRNALALIEKEAELVGKIVRPLCLKALGETEAEKKGIINRDGFYDISGRARTRQIELAKELGIKDYPSPAGGCILTEVVYGKLLATLFKLKPKADGNDCLIMRQGRVFFKDNTLIVVARDHGECLALEKLHKKTDIILKPENFMGPVVILRSFKKIPKEEIIEIGIEYILEYSKNVPENFAIELVQ